MNAGLDATAVQLCAVVVAAPGPDFVGKFDTSTSMHYAVTMHKMSITSCVVSITFTLYNGLSLMHNAQCANVNVSRFKDYVCASNIESQFSVESQLIFS